MNEMKSRFVSTVSHEFRTPLSVILSSTSLIEIYKQPEHEEKRSKHIDQILSSVKNLTSLLDDFLSYEMLEKGVIDAENSTFNLPDFLNIIIDEMTGIVSLKKQQIHYHHEGSEIVGQSKKILRNILLNLLSNASKYSPEKKDIYLTSSISNGRVSITIKDDGIGIPKKDQKNLFSEFFRAENAENIQGTGLGLTIVKKYIELLGGTISFSSKLNVGTTFTFEFPENKIENENQPK